MARTPLGTMASKYGHGTGAMSSFYGAAQRVSCPNRPFGRWADVGQRKNGRSGEKFLSTAGCAWAVLGGIPSGWGQFGAVKKWPAAIASRRVQLNAGADRPFFGTPSERSRSADQLVHRLTRQEPAPPMSGRPGTSQLPPAALLRATCGPANSTPDPLPPPLPPPVSHPAPVVASQSLEACTKSCRARAEA